MSKTCAYCDGEFGKLVCCSNCGAPYVTPKQRWTDAQALGEYVIYMIWDLFRNGRRIRFYKGDTFCGDLFVSDRWCDEHRKTHGEGADYADDWIAIFESGVRTV